MTQITGIGFSNFRVFSKSTFFDLAPISIFTGTNSSGKSSIFKGLQLLTSNSGSLDKLDFSGEGHKLGTFHMAKSRFSSSDTIRFIFKLKHRDQSLVCIDYKPAKGISECGEWSQILITLSNEVKKHYDDHELLLRLQNEGEKVKQFYNLKHVISQELNKSKQGVGVSESNPFYELFKKDKLKLEKWGGNIFSKEKMFNVLPKDTSTDVDELTSKLNSTFIELFSRSAVKVKEYDIIEQRTKYISFDDILKYFKQQYEHPKSLKTVKLNSLIANTQFCDLQPILEGVVLADVFDDLFLEICIQKLSSPLVGAIDVFKSSAQKINYIESIRANSQRLYSNQSQGTAFNELLLKVGQNWNEISKQGTDEVKFVEKWIQKFNIGDKLSINRVKGIATEVAIERDGATIDLIDLGYGVTQFLPILLYICTNIKIKSDKTIDPIIDETGEVVGDDRVPNRKIYSNNGPLLLIEEPESNLHPKLQSLLADFFIDVAQMFEVTLLIETHSEYLIRRLQVLTASGEVKSEHSVIYYLDGNLPSESDKFVRKININADGSLTNDFGPGFIDEATNWKMELMRLKNAQLQNLN